MNFLFVAVAGLKFGYGHLSRCLVLAQCAHRRGIGSRFVLFGDFDALRLVERAGFSGVVRSGQIAVEAMTQADLADIDAVVVDVTHPAVRRDIGRVRNLVDRLRGHSKSLTLIDALGDQAIAVLLADMPADVVVAPYVGAEAAGVGRWRSLVGPQYAVLSPTYVGLPPRVVREKAKRILVTCGGSDPNAFSVVVLDGLESVAAPLAIRVVIGPLFSDDLAALLAARASSSRHAVELVRAPDGLTAHMLWADLAIAVSGLVKYELAATSTPALLLSIDASHDRVNRPFANVGSARDLGADFSAKSITDAVNGLLADRKTRSAMADAGKRLIDGKGADRLIDELIGTIPC